MWSMSYAPNAKFHRIWLQGQGQDELEIGWRSVLVLYEEVIDKGIDTGRLIFMELQRRH